MDNIMTDILLVEDDLAIGKALSMWFPSNGYCLDLAQDGESAIGLGNTKSYDVILADLCLPDMNGLTVIKEIKNAIPDIIPIVITGHSSVENSIEAMRLGVNDYFEKPINLELLKTSINKKLSKRSGNQKEKFPKSLSMLVHQINNPLSVIQGNAQLAMLNLTKKKNILTLLESIINATSEINQINQKIIAIDKPVKYDQKLFDVKELLFKCLLMFKPLLELKDIEIVTNWTRQDCHILGDIFGMEQVFNNLILNAIEAMETALSNKSKLTIIVKTIPEYIEIQIKDTGKGISPQHLDKIYQSYFTTKKQGTGLGLSVIKNIIDKHLGEIHIDSQPKKGTEFNILLQKSNTGPYWN
jgi:signal transduction histidine kinase